MDIKSSTGKKNTQTSAIRSKAITTLTAPLLQKKGRNRKVITRFEPKREWKIKTDWKSIVIRLMTNQSPGGPHHTVDSDNELKPNRNVNWSMPKCIVACMNDGPHPAIHHPIDQVAVTSAKVTAPSSDVITKRSACFEIIKRQLRINNWIFGLWWSSEPPSTWWPD